MTIEFTEIKSEKQFQELHRSHGGSSFAPALFDAGYADMPSMFSVYAHMSGLVANVNLDGVQRVRIGKMIENVIAAELNILTGWEIISAREYWTGKAGATRIFVHDDDLKIGATCDRYVKAHEDGPGIVECKNRDYLQWVDNYTDDDASIRDQIQLAHQFILHPEITWGCIAVLVGGNTIKHYIYKPADLAEIMADLRTKWAELWKRVADQDEPEIVGNELPLWLEAHAASLENPPDALLSIGDDKIKGSYSFDDLVEEYQTADERAKEYAKIAKSARATIIQHLDEHKFARSNRYRVWTTYSMIKASTVGLPLDVQDGLRKLMPKLSRAEQNFLNSVVVWEKQTRKESVRVTLKFDDDPIDPEAQAAMLQAGVDAQAPLPPVCEGKDDG